MSPTLRVELDQSPNGRYSPGEWVRGKAMVVEGGGSRALKVSLHFRERSADYDTVARTEGGAPVHWGELSAGQSFDFAIQVPLDALPSYTSAHGSLYWELELKSDERGFDTVVRQPVEVVV